MYICGVYGIYILVVGLNERGGTSCREGHVVFLMKRIVMCVYMWRIWYIHSDCWTYKREGILSKNGHVVDLIYCMYVGRHNSR